MHNEYAIDPALLSTFDRIRAILDTCGWDKGKVVCEYPKNGWKRMVYEKYSGDSDVEKKKIEVILQSPIFVRRRNVVEYDKEQEWLNSVTQEHARKPFTAILINGTHDSPYIIDGRFVIEANEPKWQAPSGIVLRQARDFAMSIALLAQSSHRIVFVDPHFKYSEQRFTQPFTAMLDVALKEHYKRTPSLTSDGNPVFELHIKVEHDTTPEYITHGMQDQLPQHIPQNITINIYLWKEKEPDGEILHNRYFLTDVGGIKFGVGLDIDNTTQENNSSIQTDDVNRMDNGQHKTRLNQYCGGRTAFEPLGNFTVSGTRVY